MWGEDLGNWPFIGTARFCLGRLEYDPPNIPDPANLPSDTQPCEISQPNGTACQKGNHEPVTHQTSPRKISQMSVRLSPADQVQTKCLKSVSGNNAMIFRQRPSFVAKICFDLPQPREISASSEQADDSLNSCHVCQSRYRADSFTEFLDKCIHDNWRY